MTGGESSVDTHKWLRNLYELNSHCMFFKKFHRVKKHVTNFPIILCLCNISLYFDGVFFGFFLPPIPPHLEIWTPLFKAWICNLNVCLPSAFHAFPGVCFFSVMHLALFFSICVWLYYFICLFPRLSQATHSVFYYTQLLFHCVPRMLLMETLMEEEITH